MKLLERLAILLGLAVVGVTAVYRYALTDEQREALQDLSHEMQAATREVTDMVMPLMKDGPTKTEEEAMAAANRERTAAQWDALGY